MKILLAVFLTPLLARAGSGPNGIQILFFAGDLGQRIFQQPFSWKARGVDVRGRSSTLKSQPRLASDPDDGRSPATGFREAIAMALRTGGKGLLVESRSITVAAPPEKAFEPIRRIGGATGWYYADWLWHLRGAIDLLAGGVVVLQKTQ
jgi:hypothetical protein